MVFDLETRGRQHEHVHLGFERADQIVPDLSPGLGAHQNTGRR